MKVFLCVIICVKMFLKFYNFQTYTFFIAQFLYVLSYRKSCEKVTFIVYRCQLDYNEMCVQ